MEKGAWGNMTITPTEEKRECWYQKTVGDGGRKIKPYWVFIGWVRVPNTEPVKETAAFTYYQDGAGLCKFRKPKED